VGAKGVRAPTKFTPERRERYLKLLAKGGRRIASARKCGVSEDLIEKLVKEDPEFHRALEFAEEQANEMIEDSLFQKAMSGNTTAILFWLMNRKPDVWKDMRKVVGDDPASRELMTQTLQRLAMTLRESSPKQQAQVMQMIDAQASVVPPKPTPPNGNGNGNGHHPDWKAIDEPGP
jgi:hypothetical protein